MKQDGLWILATGVYARVTSSLPWIIDVMDGKVRRPDVEWTEALTLVFFLLFFLCLIEAMASSLIGPNSFLFIFL